MTLTPKPEVHQFLENLGDLISFVLPLIGEAGVSSAFDKDIAKILPDVQEQIKWSGKGALLSVPVGYFEPSGEVFYGGVRFLGTGDTASRALAKFMSEPQISSPLPNWYSKEKSFYVWVEVGSGRLGVIDYPFSESVLLSGLALASDELLLKEIKKADGRETFLSAVDELRRRAASGEQAKIIFDAGEKIRGYLAERRDIDIRLADEISKQARVGAFLQKMKILSALVSVGQLAMEFAKEFPDSNLGGFLDGDKLLLEQEIDSYSNEVDGKIVQIKSEVSVWKKLTSDQIILLRKYFDGSKVPGDILSGGVQSILD